MALVFVMLGSWQTNRASEKSTVEQQHQSALPLSIETAISQNSRFSRIEIRGRYDTRRHILLDNQIWQGRGGIYVFTPFYTTAGRSILVNRGWLQLAPDRSLELEIPTPEGELTLNGMLNTAPVPGRMLGPADTLTKEQWPQLVTYLNLSDISSVLDLPLEDWVVQLSKSEKHGFDGREWKPVFLSSGKHKAYAFQWFALATACVIMWLVVGFRRTPRKNK